MAREYAKLKTAIWGDDDYRALPVDAQWLYQYLFSSPKIDICGVTDWDVRKIAAKAIDLTVERVRAAGSILHQRGFIVVDDDTEEVLVRTYIKHDGSLRGPKTAKGVANAWADVSSDLIRTVIAHEAVKIRDANPDWSGVSEVTLKMIEKASGYRPDTLSDPYPEGMPEASGDVRPIPSAYPTDTPSETDPILLMANGYLPPLDGELVTNNELTLAAPPEPKSARKTPYPAAWEPAANQITYADEHNIDVWAEAEKFRDRNLAEGRKYANWDRAFAGWLRLGHEKGWATPKQAAKTNLGCANPFEGW